MSSDILDREPVPRDRVHEFGGVIINVPTIYVVAADNGVSETHADRTTDNLRVIAIDRLDELMRLSLDILTATHERLIDLWEILVERLIAYNKESDDAAAPAKGGEENEILKFLSFASRMGREMDVADEYVDSTNATAITFDVIRRYRADEHTSLLIEATIEPWRDPHTGILYSFYSQLAATVGTGADVVERVRRERNDTDLMRYHYCLQQYERALRFEPQHVCDRTVRLANLALFYLCLVSASRPIEYLSSNDLKANILGFVIDAVIRSRVIGAWQRDPAGRAMLNDLTRNYEDAQIMVQLCRLTTSRERAKFMLAKFATIERVREAVRALSYDAYEELLENHAKRVIDDVPYYVFNSTFLASAASMQGFGALRSMYESSSSSDNKDDDDNDTVIRKLLQR